MLRSITADVWVLEDDLHLPLGMRLPSRTTILRLKGDKLFICSPLAFDDERAREIEALGEVSWIVAPSNVHYLFLAEAAKRWPGARILGPPGLEKKVKDLAFDPLPIQGAPDELGGEIELRRIEGVPYMVEHVFLHRPSRALIVTDLVFNVHACRSFGMPLFLRGVGAWKKTAQSRVWRLLTKDREAAGRSVLDILSWDFDRVVMAHGDIIETGGHAPLANALQWLT